MGDLSHDNGNRNAHSPDYSLFLGAGAYHHFLPAVAEEMRSIREEPLPPALPWHLIRFCDMSNGNYLVSSPGWDNGAALVKASDASTRGGVTKPTKGGKTDA